MGASNELGGKDLTLRQFIKSLIGIEKQYGDMTVSMWNAKTEKFESGFSIGVPMTGEKADDPLGLFLIGDASDMDTVVKFFKNK